MTKLSMKSVGSLRILYGTRADIGEAIVLLVIRVQDIPVQQQQTHSCFAATSIDFIAF
jgi:hypothetical protein